MFLSKKIGETMSKDKIQISNEDQSQKDKRAYDLEERTAILSKPKNKQLCLF